MGAAIPRTFKPRIVLSGFIYGVAVQIGQPSLDVPGRHQDGNVIRVVPWRYRRSVACFIERPQPGINTVGVAIKHGYKLTAYSVSVPAICLDLLREFLADELLARALGFG